ncbi:hypothetical protein OPKNFCMD_6729 [Methylobacterium crusticola]|uniref:CzcB-like C-terminal circularly permuted SH3-like domain-containing protein n=1 Tax=Methylobacterium crusticola TaxID=1697972 RepID=A0ABQ4RA17_9HYPH|nr:HlyD family efflux transporter periplasmic adaptor subunit [Methylobacterium crusticola]GJD53949.1 hypothetical protein OPKNFCMD_6729 [Methylobacterium crusticola]
MRPDPRPARPPVARVPGAVLLAGALACGLAAARAAEAEPPRDAAPATVAARKACFSDTVRVTGYLTPRRESYVTLNFEGFRIAEVFVQEGDTVSAGQDLIRFVRAVVDDPVMSTRLPTTFTLKAPQAGTVARSIAQVGVLTSAQSEPLIRIVADRDLDLNVQVPSLYITRIRAGAPTRILVGADTELKGEVRIPATDVDPATQFGRAVLTVPPAPGLRPGLFARALIDAAGSCGLAVPRSAILRRSDTTSVQVMREGRIETRRVVVGFSSEDEVEIRGGLTEGEPVVANAGMAF